MKNKNTIFVIASIVFGLLALVTIFLGVGSLYHSAYRELYDATTQVPTIVGPYDTSVPTQIGTGTTAIQTMIPSQVTAHTSYIPTLVSREWFELSKQGSITGLDIIFGGSIQTTKYGKVVYQSSPIGILPYVFVVLGVIAAALRLVFKKLNSRYMNILIGLLFVIGAGLFLVQIPSAKLAEESVTAIQEICKADYNAIKAEYFLDESLTVRQVLKPSIINYLGVAASFIAAVCAIMPFYFGLGKEESQA